MTIRPHHILRQVAVITAILLATLPGSSRGQAVDATMSLSRPGANVAYAFDELYDTEKPRVVLVRPAGWSGQDAVSLSSGRDAAYSWEIFLLGLQLPYRTIDTAELGHGVPKDTRLLILPAADALGSKQRRNVLQFVDKGGALVASGRLGAIDDRGRAAGDGFFADLLGAEFVTRVPDQPFGLLHSIDGMSPVSAGVDPGFRLNVSAQRPLTAARAVTGHPFGRPYSYSGRDDDRLADLTLMLGNQHGKGRVFWSRFNPQDVSREREQQLAYQRMMVNAIAYVTGSDGVSIAAWPQGSPSALAITSLPSVGFDALSYLGGWHDFLDMIRSAGVPATFFLSSRESAGFPDIIQAMHQLGEVAIAGETDDVISGMPHDVQAQKLDAARRDVGMTGGVGVYPPGGFYDGNTVRAMLDGGFGYLLLPAQWSLAPGIARWWDDVDYRAVRASAADAGDLPFLTARSTSGPQTVDAPAEEPVVTMPLDPGIGDYPNRFARIHAAGGLYVLPYFPEITRNGSGRARQLAETIQAARTAGSWVATLGDIARWWSARSHVWIETGHSDGEGLDIDLTNDFEDAVEGLTLILKVGDIAVDSIDADGLDVAIHPGDVKGTYKAVIGRLPVGSTRLRLNFN